MTNLLRTDTRVHEHAVSNDRVSYRDSTALVRRVQEGRIPRVSSYTTTAWWRYNRSVTPGWVPLASSVLSAIVIGTQLSPVELPLRMRREIIFYNL